MKKVLYSILLFPIICIAQSGTVLKGHAERMQLAAEMERSITTGLLNKWYPGSVDSLYGGFISTYTYDFKPTGPQDKFIVTQARHTWTTSKAAEAYPQVLYYIKCAAQGFRFLRNVMWDKTYGGFYSLVDRKGRNKSNKNVPKEAYGNASRKCCTWCAIRSPPPGETSPYSLRRTGNLFRFMILQKRLYAGTSTWIMFRLAMMWKPLT
jgi:mannobiose 2-epimerase